MERLRFIGKRLIYLVIMLLGVATLVFILTKLIPGDPVTANLSQRALSDPEIVAAYKMRYGLDNEPPKTLEDVGKAFNVTRERIRQIEAKALRKLRHPSRSKKVRDYLEK